MDNRKGLHMTRRWIATACTTLATAACVAMPATAAAVTSTEFPIETSNDSPIYITEIDWAISPYGPNATCGAFHGVPTECWQQTPDGTWRKLARSPYGAGNPGFAIYPVWEDPASLANVSTMIETAQAAITKRPELLEHPQFTSWLSSGGASSLSSDGSSLSSQ